MRYQTSIVGDYAVIRSDKPAEVAKQLLDAATDPFEVRTVTDRGVAFRVPLHVAERSGFVDYPDEVRSKDTDRGDDRDTTPQGAGTGDNDASPTGDPTEPPNGATGAASASPEAPRRNGSTSEWSKFLTEQGIEHDENASRDHLVQLWDARNED